MTAYSRVSVETEVGHFLIEIQSVNRKYLEINTDLPKDLLRFDSNIKKWITNAISRGQVNVKVFSVADKEKSLMIIPNIPLAREIKNAWDKIAQELGLSGKEGFNLQMLLEEKDILNYEEVLHDVDLYQKILHEIIQKGLKDLIDMKTQEGAHLQQDILQRLNLLAEAIKKIEAKADNSVSKYRQKLIQRLEEVLPGSVENEDKILREVCIYAEKVDVSEEIVRFHSHLKQVQVLIHSEATNIGKKLEFLLQELHREINTIGSKCADVDISHAVVDVKTELERIREQIQNVE